MKWMLPVLVLIMVVSLFLMRSGERPNQEVIVEGVKISIGYTRIDDDHYVPTIDGGKYRPLHAYVVVRDLVTGSAITTRAGPEKCKDIYSGSPKSNIGSNISSCSSYCKDDALEPNVRGEETWLYAVVHTGDMDCKNKPTYVQQIGTVMQPFDGVKETIEEMVRRNNECKENFYRPLGLFREVNNSNSYAFSVVQQLIGRHPKPTAPGISYIFKPYTFHPVHGWNMEVGTNEVNCLEWPPRFSLARVLELCLKNTYWFTNNSCTLPPNRWIYGDDALPLLRKKRQVALNQVIAQTSNHFLISENKNLQKWSEKLGLCALTYHSYPFFKHDSCHISNKRYKAIEMIASVAAQARQAGI